MTDLSYTNKDGLNLYEGFDNGFNYHRDGAAEGDGYAHGGYPEVTGETSDYTDTSYKTGDDPDFFDNGNVWVQPSVNPGSTGSTPLPLDWYKVNGEKINSVTQTGEVDYDFHQYIVETDLETDIEKCIHILGHVAIETDTDEPYPIITVTSANYVTMSGNTITETLGEVSGISITGDLDYDGYVNMNTTYKGNSISESFSTENSQDTTQQ